jgi:hypothetical protein
MERVITANATEVLRDTRQRLDRATKTETFVATNFRTLLMRFTPEPSSNKNPSNLEREPGSSCD